jgi:hypothetical protein
MKFSKLMLAGLTALSLGTMMEAVQAAPLTVGTTSAYYLNNYADNRIYVVQGTSVINSFLKTRSGGQQEGNLAVSNGVISTKSFYGNSGGGATAGQYTTSGTAIGGGYNARAVPTGTANNEAFDGTSNGTNNFTVEWSNSQNTQRVLQYDLNWQNPVAIFNVTNSGCCQELNIAYNPLNNTLWVGGYGTNQIANYSMTGALLSLFSVGHSFSAAMGFDAADGTLWLSNGQGNNFEQWSTTGTLLQSGSFTGLAGGNYLAGDFQSNGQSSVPAPGALALLGLGLLGLGAFRRRKAA